MLERIGSTLSLYGRYDLLFDDSSRVQECLRIVYDDILSLLVQAKKLFEKSGFRLFVRSAWATFESDFDVGLENLARHSVALDEEITFEHRRRLQKFILAEKNSPPITTAGPIVADLNAQEKELLLQWLDPPEMSQILQHYAEKKLAGTCNWLSKDEQFVNWINEDHNPWLWIRGLAGCGKSVLSTVAVQECVGQSTTTSRLVTSYYFQYHSRSRQTLTMMHAAIIAQILMQDPTAAQHIYKVYQIAKRFGRSRISTMDNPEYILTQLLSTRSRLDIIVDGLDEFDCPSEILKSFDRMIESTSKIHIIVFSRDTTAIRSSLPQSLLIELRQDIIQYDIELTIRTAVTKFSFENLEESEKLVLRVLQKTKGMFLWTNEVLKSFESGVSPSQLLVSLELMPDGLLEYYERHMDYLATLPPPKVELARRVFQWVCCAFTQLTWEELQLAISDPQSSVSSPASDRPFKNVVFDICGPFAYHDSDDGKIKLQHSSVHQYLTNTKNTASQPPSTTQESSTFFVSIENAHLNLATTCLQQISMDNRDENPLYEYALRYWCDHAVLSLESAELRISIKTFLGAHEHRRCWIRTLLVSNHKDLSLQKLFSMQQLLKRRLFSQEGTDSLCFQATWTEDVTWALFKLDSEALQGRGRKLTYFENLMVVRDLSRELAQTSMLQEGVGWFRDFLHSQSGHREESKIAWVLNSLGILYDQQGDTTRSLETHLRALAIQERAFGSSHMETLWTINELGRVYRHLGNWIKAEEMHKNALAFLITELPSDHLEILWTQNTLARVYRRQGQHTKGLALHERALEGRTRILGHQHPHTLWILGDMAQCYRDLGQLTKAEELHRQALRGREAELGPEHPDTLWTMNNLGVVLAEQGKRMEAIAVQKTALRGQKRRLGRQHAHTCWTAEVLQKLEGNEKSGALSVDRKNKDIS